MNALDCMSQLFKFKIGETVCQKVWVDGIRCEADLNGPAASYNRVGAPVGFMVVGRVLEECHGGVQLHYRLSGTTSGGEPADHVTRSELELVPIADAVEATRLAVPVRKPA